MLSRLDPTLHFNAYPALYLSDANLGPLVNRPTSVPILSLHAPIVSIYGPPWLYFEPLQHLNLDGDPDPGFHNIQLPSVIRIRIRKPGHN